VLTENRTIFVLIKKDLLQAFEKASNMVKCPFWKRTKKKITI